MEHSGSERKRGRGEDSREDIDRKRAREARRQERGAREEKPGKGLEDGEVEDAGGGGRDLSPASRAARRCDPAVSDGLRAVFSSPERARACSGSMCMPVLDDFCPLLCSESLQPEHVGGAQHAQ